MTARHALDIRTGPDARLRNAAWVLPSLALLYGLSASWAMIPALFLVCLVPPLVAIAVRNVQSTRLTLYPDGRARWTEPSHPGRKGLVRASSWTTGRYSVICIDTAERPQRFLVSMRNQEPGNYSALLGWLVLRFPNQSLQERGKWQNIGK